MTPPAPPPPAPLVLDTWVDAVELAMILCAVAAVIIAYLNRPRR